MIRRAAIIISLGAGLLTGCAGQPSQSTHEAKPAKPAPAQTMIVPAAHNPLAKTIRQTLSASGWHLAQYPRAGAHNTPADAHAMAQRARYRLTLTASPAGDCRGDEPSFMYRLSIIDNASGRVPLAMSGADCLGAIKQQFQRELAADGLSPKTAASSASQRPKAE